MTQDCEPVIVDVSLYLFRLACVLFLSFVHKDWVIFLCKYFFQANIAIIWTLKTCIKISETLFSEILRHAFDFA